MTVSVNVVVLAGTIAADPVERRMPSGEECTEIRLSVPEAGRRLLPLPVVAWHTELHIWENREVVEALERLAEANGRSMSAEIRGAIRASLIRNDPTSGASHE